MLIRISNRFCGLLPLLLGHSREWSMTHGPLALAITPNIRRHINVMLVKIYEKKDDSTQNSIGQGFKLVTNMPLFAQPKCL